MLILSAAKDLLLVGNSKSFGQRKRSASGYKCEFATNTLSWKRETALPAYRLLQCLFAELQPAKLGVKPACLD